MNQKRAAADLRLKVAMPLVLFVTIAAVGLLNRSLVPMQLAMMVPILYGLVYFTAGAIAYRPRSSEAAPTALADAELPLVSIMIPAHNEETVIANTVTSMLRLDYPRFEVIVIDDHSSDRTSEIVRGFQGVKLVQRRNLPNRGKSEALNAGLEFCEGDVLCIFDADSEVAPDFLRKAVPHLVDNPEICGVQAQVRMYNRKENQLTASQDDEFAVFNEILQLGRTVLGGASALGGNGQLTKRSALMAVGGWNPGSLTEDLDLTMRLLLAGRGRIHHATEAIVWQEGVTTVGGLIRQRQRWAEGMLRTYGDFAAKVVSSKDLAPHVRLDAYYTLFSVFFPFLTLLGIIHQFLFAIPGLFLTTLPVLVGNTVSFLIIGGACSWSAMISWKRDRKIDVRPGLRYTLYILHWTPALMVALRNVFTDKAVVWEKTEHRGHAPVAAPAPATSVLATAGGD